MAILRFEISLNNIEDDREVSEAILPVSVCSEV